LPLKIVAKPLQMATWLLLTAYKMSPVPYPMVPSTTLYDLPFSHSTAWFAYQSALWPLKVIQGQRFSCHLKANMRLPISSQYQPRPYLATLFNHNTSVTNQPTDRLINRNCAIDALHSIAVPHKTTTYVGGA